jgi:two-component system cell cycle sensor histidine kinase/response regulator CckA
MPRRADADVPITTALADAPPLMPDFDQPPQPAHASSPSPQTAPAAAVDPSATERQRLDQQAYLQHALAVSVIGVWHVEIATGAQWWSAETYQLFGVDPSTAPLTVDAFYARVHPEDHERVRAATRRALETGAVYDVEHRIVTPLGLEKWVHERASVERAADGTPRRLVGVVRDITDTRLAEEALRSSRSRLQAIVQNMPVLMTALDDDGQFVFWNSECERVTGFSAEDVLSDPGFIHRFIPDPIERARMRRDVPLPGVEFRDWELTITCKDGTKRTIAWSNSPGECPLPEWSTWSVGVDVTERKQLEEQFLQSQKMEAIGRLAGGIAHDFNNLLTVVQGYTDVILGEIATTHPHRPALEQVKRAGERAAALTRQLLLFTRRQVVEARVVDLNAIVRELDRMLRRLIGEDLELDIRTVGESCPIKTDPGQIEQILMNLAVNARDAMPSGGRLVIETALQTVTASQAARRANMPAGSWICLRVSDNGTGMDHDTLAHIFEPFFTTKAPGQGTGLGLATVFGIVQQNGGHIDVSSTKGVGSIFTIYLPRTTEPMTPSGVHRIARLPAKGDETILLVEDDDDVRELAREGLMLRGYKVLDVRDGSEAFLLSQGYQGPIHIMVTDVIMPIMNGPQVAELIAIHRPATRVLFISGYTGDLPFTPQPGGQQPVLLYKPFTIDVLARKVRDVLDS